MGFGVFVMIGFLLGNHFHDQGYSTFTDTVRSDQAWTSSNNQHHLLKDEHLCIKAKSARHYF